MVAHILVVTITTMASEATFSVGGKVIDPYHGSLNPKTVEALIYTGDWLRHQHGVTEKVVFCQFEFKLR